MPTTYTLSLSTAVAMVGNAVAPINIGGSTAILDIAKKAREADFGLELPLLDLPGLRTEADFEYFLDALALIDGPIDVVRSDETMRGRWFWKTDVRFQLEAWRVARPVSLFLGEKYCPVLLKPFESEGAGIDQWEQLAKIDVQLRGVAIDTTAFLAFPWADQERLLKLLAEYHIEVRLLRVTVNADHYYGLLKEDIFCPPYNLLKEGLRKIRLSKNLVVVFDIPPRFVDLKGLQTLRERVGNLLRRTDD